MTLIPGWWSGGRGWQGWRRSQKERHLWTSHLFSSLPNFHLYLSLLNIIFLAEVITKVSILRNKAYIQSSLIMANTAMTAKIEGVQDIIDYKFSNPLILWEALQAAGSPVFSIGDRRLFDGNKRLAVLGDIVLDLALAEPWYQGTEPRGGHSVYYCRTHLLMVFRPLGPNQEYWHQR